MRYSNEPRMRSAVIFSYFLQLLSQSLHLRYVPRNQWLNIAAASQRYLDLEAFVKMAKLLKEDFEPVHKATVNPNKNEKIKRTVGKWQESASGERFDSLQKNRICERKQNGRQFFFFPHRFTESDHSGPHLRITKKETSVEFRWWFMLRRDLHVASEKQHQAFFLHE